MELLGYNPDGERFVPTGIYETVCLPSNKACGKTTEPDNTPQHPPHDQPTAAKITTTGTYSLPDMSKKKVWWAGEE